MDAWWGTSLPFITYFPAILLAAWLGGRGPGLLTTFLGAAGAAYLWVSPIRSVALANTAEILALAVYCCIGVVISLLTAKLHRARMLAERLLVQEQLARQEAEAGHEASLRLAAIVKSSDDAIVGKSLDGIVTSWNAGAERMLGYTAEEMIGQSILRIVPPERASEEQMVLSRLRRGESIEHYDTVRIRKDGERITVSLTVSPIRNAAGVIIGASKIARDITVQARAAAERTALLERAERARRDAEAAEQHAKFLAEAGRLLSASLDYEATLAQIVHLAVPRLADMAAVDLVDPPDRIRRVAAAHRDAAKERLLLDLRNEHGFRADAARGVPNVIRTRRSALVTNVSDEELVAAATSEAQLETFRTLGMSSWIIVPLIARDTVLGALTFVMTDSGRRYTEQDLRLAEAIADRAASAMDNAQLYRRADVARAQAELASRAKDDFLATLSHELRTPLTAVYGWARMLPTLTDPETRDKALDVILRNARMQVQMIDDLLDVSRIVTGKMRLDVHPVDLAAVVEAALDVVRPAADSKSIRLHAVLDPRAGPVLGDADRLQQVVWNLAMNAVKFTPRNGRIEVALRRVDSHVELLVSDSGQGIAADDLPYIFERFHQGESGSARGHGGLGIGLALVRHLVELHGGSVLAESRGKGQGATFIVRLPVSIARPVSDRADHGHGVAAVAPHDAPSLAGLDVVVVDDDPDSLDLVRTILTSAGASVTAFSSAVAAFAHLSRVRPDLVVSDVEMPGEDGYSLARRIRALPPERGGRLPVLALTAYGRTEDRLRAISAGFTLHLAKPVDPAELVAMVASVAGRSTSPAA
jgi:PAS domain S-box-containing protein